MTFLIFIIILGLLILVHELGHFLVAKKAGVRVDEFGFGYPPKAVSLGKKWGTEFTLNWIPFGGFVKIYGEDYKAQSAKRKAQEKQKQPASSDSRLETFSFTDLSRKWQAAVLAAGVFFNFLFAWALFSLAFLIGVPTPVNNSFGGEARDPSLTIVNVLPDSPAKVAGLKSGDKIVSASSDYGELEVFIPEEFSNFIDNSESDVRLKVDRGGKIINLNTTPVSDGAEGGKLIGVGVDMVGTLSLPLHKALFQGGKTTLLITYLTARGIVGLVGDAFLGRADLSQVTGPVGIVGLVGEASALGFAYLVTFTALISINLAIVNLIPFPALDGGRLLLVGIESVKKSPVNPKFVGILNMVGFFLLIALMVIITFKDVVNLF